MFFRIPAHILVFTLLMASAALAQDCKQPLDQKTLDYLRLGLRPDIQLQPGTTYQFKLGIYWGYAPPEFKAACATWKVEPAGQGATITSDGLLAIDGKTPARSKFTATADIEKGRAQRTMYVYVYTREAQPLVGLWREKSESDCTVARVLNVGELIREFEFRAGGYFFVTWTPFETYYDYWGRYMTGEKGALTLTVDRGNFVPKNFRGAGHYVINEQGELELRGIALGHKAPVDPDDTKPISEACHYVFTRTALPE